VLTSAALNRGNTARGGPRRKGESEGPEKGGGRECARIHWLRLPALLGELDQCVSVGACGQLRTPTPPPRCSLTSGRGQTGLLQPLTSRRWQSLRGVSTLWASRVPRAQPCAAPTLGSSLRAESRQPQSFNPLGRIGRAGNPAGATDR
jgi:hypothetical protein